MRAYRDSHTHVLPAIDVKANEIITQALDRGAHRIFIVQDGISTSVFRASNQPEPPDDSALVLPIGDQADSSDETGDYDV